MSDRSLPGRIAGPALRQGLCFALGLACLWWLGQRLQQMELGAIAATLGTFTAAQWLAAGGATAISFWALGRYDLILHGLTRADQPPRHAARAGITALALSQTLGFGLFTGAVIRWKMLPGMAFSRALALTGAIALAFLGCWALVLALASLGLGGPLPPALSLTVVLAACGFAVLSVLRPSLRLAGRSLRLPPLRAMAAMLALTAVDVTAAAVALHVFLPETIGLATLLPAFLLAFGIGLVSGTPGGVGPFELGLLALLAPLPEAEIIAAVLAFRLIYYALPACLGLAVLTASHLRHPAPPVARPRHVTLPLHHAHRAETAVIRQNQAEVTRLGGTQMALLDTGQSLTALFDPLTGCAASALPQFSALARSRGLTPLLYKCGARTALAARRSGWTVARIADEAVLNPQTHSTQGAPFRQLRRKLRQAEKAGVTTALLSGTLPMAQLAQIAEHWRLSRGGERGTSMGSFCPDYIRNQLIFGAFQGDRLTAFVTFHQSRHELCLDLVRSRDDTPDGAMQMLILAAIAYARRQSLTRLSLAAVPTVPDTRMPRPTRALLAHISNQPGTQGLRRYKAAFAPRWQPLYAAAPGPGALLLGLADMARAVHAPQHLPDNRQPARPHNDLENYVFASSDPLWHPRLTPQEGSPP